MTNYSLYTPEEVAQQKKDWANDVFMSSDLYMREYCGYWLTGITRIRGVWIAWELDEDDLPTQEEWRVKRQQAIEAFTNGDGDPLPHGFFAMTRELADKAWEIGKEKWGEGWYDDSDATSYDIVTQLALLGEIRYG